MTHVCFNIARQARYGVDLFSTGFRWQNYELDKLHSETSLDNAIIDLFVTYLHAFLTSCTSHNSKIHFLNFRQKYPSRRSMKKLGILEASVGCSCPF